jgi:hypothetical protein
MVLELSRQGGIMVLELSRQGGIMDLELSRQGGIMVLELSRQGGIMVFILSLLVYIITKNTNAVYSYDSMYICVQPKPNLYTVDYLHFMCITLTVR